MRSSPAFYLVPIALGALAYPVAVLALRWFDRVMSPLEGASWPIGIAYLVALAVPPLIIVLGGTAVAARLAARPDLGRLLATAAGAAIAWSALLYLVLDHLPSRRNAEESRADSEHRTSVQRELDQTTQLGPITHSLAGRRLEIELPITTSQARRLQVRISLWYWHAPTHVVSLRCDHVEDVELAPGRTIVRASCEQDWVQGDPATSRTTVSAAAYQEVTREGRGLGAASVYTSLDIPGVAGPRQP